MVYTLAMTHPLGRIFEAVSFGQREYCTAMVVNNKDRLVFMFMCKRPLCSRIEGVLDVYADTPSDAFIYLEKKNTTSSFFFSKGLTFCENGERVANTERRGLWM